MKQYHKIFALFTVSVFIGLAFFSISTYAQFISTVQDSAFNDEDRMKPIVSFYHDEHNMAAGIYDCNTCHHVWEDGEILPYEDSVGMECSSCHLAEPGDNKMDLIRAYHLQCRSCHMDEKAGPILCGECHTGEE